MKVFLRYYAELPFPLREVERTIAGLPGECLDAAARDANLRGLLMLDTPATLSEPNLTVADVCVSLLAPQTEGAVIRRTLQWLAVRGDAIVCVLRGDLELAELGPARTQLAISAQYRPGAVVQATQRMAAQRVGESTLKAFLDRLANYVQLILGERPAAAINRSVIPDTSIPAGTRVSLGVVRRVAT